MATTVGTIEVVASINTKDYDAGKKQIEKGNKELETGAKKTSSSFSSAWTGAIIGVAASLTNTFLNAVKTSVTGAVKRVDTLNNAPRVLENLGFSAEEASKAIKLIDKGTRGLPTSLDEIASSLVSIASASGLGIDDATKLTVAFNNMALAGGKGSAEAQRALTQFTQALGRGAFQAQDFNTLMEVMPAQLNQLAQSLLGPESNAIQLRDALTSGEVSMGQFTDAIVNLNAEGGDNFASFADQAKTATSGVETSWSLVQTAITRGMGDIISAVGSENISSTFESIRKAVDSAFDGIESMIGFIKDNKDVFTALAVAIGTATAAMIAYNTTMKIVAATTALIRTATALYTVTTAAMSQGLGVARAAMFAFNLVLGANPIGIVITLIAALVAGLIYFFTQTETGKKIIETAFGAIKNAFSGAFNWVKKNWPLLLAILTGPIGLAVLAIVRNFDKIKSVAQSVWNWIKGAFGKIGEIGTSVIKGAVNSVIGFAERTINGFIRLINNALGAINKIPGVNIGKIGELSIPKLAKGGIVSAPTLAMIGEGRESEAVIPLSELDKILANERSKGSSGGNGEPIIHQTNNVYTELDMNVVNRRLAWELHRA